MQVVLRNAVSKDNPGQALYSNTAGEAGVIMRKNTACCKILCNAHPKQAGTKQVINTHCRSSPNCQLWKSNAGRQILSHRNK